MKRTIRLNESQFNELIFNTVKKVLNEGRPFQLGKGYTHFAIDKESGKIINGWDYKGYDPEDLKSDKNSYFYNDLEDYFDNNDKKKRDVQIVGRKQLESKGVDIKDTNNWYK